MPYDPDRHHRRSIRLQNYDYAQAGAYFITICVHQGWLTREGISSAANDIRLGIISESEMHLNQYGELVKTYWDKIPIHHPRVELDEFVIMPNHLHGIIVIDKSGKTGIPAMIRIFKSFSTTRINQLRKMRGAPVWQRNYYEHIIRNEADLARIREYVVNNPAKWSEDKYYS